MSTEPSPQLSSIIFIADPKLQFFRIKDETENDQKQDDTHPEMVLSHGKSPFNSAPN